MGQGLEWRKAGRVMGGIRRNGSRWGGEKSKSGKRLWVWEGFRKGKRVRVEKDKGRGGEKGKGRTMVMGGVGVG